MRACVLMCVCVRANLCVCVRACAYLCVLACLRFHISAYVWEGPVTEMQEKPGVSDAKVLRINASRLAACDLLHTVSTTP